MSELERDPNTPESQEPESSSAAEQPEALAVEALAEEAADAVPSEGSAQAEPEAQADSAQPAARKRHESIQEQRLEALTAAISAAPDDPINYVLRGELRLALGDRDGAAEDFRRGLLLIAAIGETDWGYLHSLLADRAQEGLRHCS
ncbi:MAG: hypothetical protein D6749_00705 [Chloroflexota bacterium]|nr:MAG: hypothetical protein D6749_00705 [Chloroflexota bacterium]